MSIASQVHGALLMVLGSLAIFSPENFKLVLTTVLDTPFSLIFGSHVAVPDSSVSALAFLGVIMFGWGVRDYHAGKAATKAAAGLLCSCSTMAGMFLVAGYWTGGEKIFYCMAPISAAFSAWAFLEIQPAAVAPKPKAK